MHPSKKKGLTALHRDQATTETHSSKNRNRNLIMSLTADNRSKHLRQRRAAWWTIAVLAALVAVLANNGLITDALIWGAFVVVTRLEVVDRRRARRAAHRASLLEEHAIRQAVALANAAHAELEAVAA